MLHVPTLFVALLAAFVMFGIILAAARRALPNWPELALWTRATWLTIAGFLFLVSRAVGPAWLSVLGGNGLVIYGLYLNSQALHRFIAQRAAPRWQGALVGVIIAVAVAMLSQPLALRTAVISALFALAIWPMVRLVLREGWRREPSLRTVGILLALTMLALAARAAHALLRPAEYNDFFQASLGNGLTYFASYLFPLGAGVGFILANLERAASQLRALAAHDSLTGCLNRGSFDLLFANACERARREHAPLALLLVDLDEFKRINDRHGHPSGDAVLRAFADCARGQLRASDLLARFGGEEFAVLLPGTDAAGATKVAEAMRRAAEDLAVAAADGAPMRFTVSAGVALFAGGPKDSADAVYQRADSALYAAKRTGRNRVMLQAAP